MLTKLLLKRLEPIQLRQPDFVVGGVDDPYLLRWWVIPRNKYFNVYLHLFLRSDDDRAHHDHPWLFNLSYILQNRYLEWTIKRGGVGVAKQYDAGNVRLRLGAAPHRIELLPGESCLTLFVTGPVTRDWGFCCPKGWVPWRQFTAKDDAGSIGAGCGDKS